MKYTSAILVALLVVAKATDDDYVVPAGIIAAHADPTVVKGTLLSLFVVIVSCFFLSILTQPPASACGMTTQTRSVQSGKNSVPPRAPQWEMTISCVRLPAAAVAPASSATTPQATEEPVCHVPHWRITVSPLVRPTTHV